MLQRNTTQHERNFNAPRENLLTSSFSPRESPFSTRNRRPLSSWPSDSTCGSWKHKINRHGIPAFQYLVFKWQWGKILFTVQIRLSDWNTAHRGTLENSKTFTFRAQKLYYFKRKWELEITWGDTKLIKTDKEIGSTTWCG